MDAEDHRPTIGTVSGPTPDGDQPTVPDEGSPGPSGSLTRRPGPHRATTVEPAPEKTARPPFRLGNRPPLTGFRAFALSTVLVYHSNFKTWPGSWIAIQMFFVLSGFLITAMLAGEGDRNGRVSLKGFYSRRAARLLPPLMLTIAVIIIYASFVHVADASARVYGDSAAAMFYYADYRQAFGHAPFFGYLAQTWSLSVEEQFYVIWSVLMVTAVSLRRRGLAYGFAIAGLALSIGDRLWQAYSAPHFDDAVFTRIYYAFDTRADALFLGCLLGLLATDGYLSGWKRMVGPDLVGRRGGLGRLHDLDPLQLSAVPRANGRLVDTADHHCLGHHHRLLRDLSHWPRLPVRRVGGLRLPRRSDLHPLPGPLPRLSRPPARRRRNPLVVLADRAGPPGHHLCHRHRQLVPDREAPLALAPALRRPLTINQDAGGRPPPRAPRRAHPALSAGSWEEVIRVTARSPTRPT